MKKFALPAGVFVFVFFFLQAWLQKEEPADKADLGKMLFFDPILSSDKKISCASCHQPKFAFADTSAVSKGVGGRSGKRNTPSAMNVRLHQLFFWDGRSPSLEEQALAPIENPDEMNLPVDVALQRLNGDPRYRKFFMKIFSAPANRQNLGQAIAAFERTLETSDSDFDRWKFTGDEDAVSDSVKRGFEIFNTKGKCISCHFGADFTANEFRNIGLFDGRGSNDSGRAVVTHLPNDIGRFKTPGLRNIRVTGPYMHDGRFKTLEEVIRFYNEPDQFVPDAINRDSLLSKPLGLTGQEIRELELFLISLTDKRFLKGNL